MRSLKLKSRNVNTFIANFSFIKEENIINQK